MGRIIFVVLRYLVDMYAARLQPPQRSMYAYVGTLCYLQICILISYGKSFPCVGNLCVALCNYKLLAVITSLCIMVLTSAN